MLNIAQNIESITESSVDRQARDVQFIMDIMEQNREMERFVNESIILASGNKRAIQEMAIFNEAAAGDRIKGFFQKIKDFFKKIFTKLGASLSAVFAEQKKYCEQYAYIITKCKWQAGDVNDINDYFKGIPRITDMINGDVNQTLFAGLADKGLISGADGTSAATNKVHDLTNLTPPAKEDAEKLKNEAFSNFLAKSTYWNDKNIVQQNNDAGTVNVDKTFRDYFNGAADTVSYSGDEIENNFQIVINNVYAGQSYLTKLEKIVTSVDKKMDDISKNSEAEMKDLETKLKTAAKTPANNNGNKYKKSDIVNNGGKFTHPAFPGIEGSSETDLITNINQSLQGQNKPSAIFESAVVQEMNISGGSSNTSEVDNKSAANKFTGTGTQQTTRAGETNTAITQTKAADNKAKNTVTGDASSGANDAAITAYIDAVNHNMQAKVNAEIQITSAIARAAFGAFKSANSDFFKIIQAHVQWYLSNPGSEKATENQSTRPRNLNLNGDSQVDTKPASTS